MDLGIQMNDGVFTIVPVPNVDSGTGRIDIALDQDTNAIKVKFTWVPESDDDDLLSHETNYQLPGDIHATMLMGWGPALKTLVESKMDRWIRRFNEKELEKLELYPEIGEEDGNSEDQ